MGELYERILKKCFEPYFSSPFVSTSSWSGHKGKEPPQWMSTHPSSTKRIINLNLWIPEIIIKYPPIKKIV